MRRWTALALTLASVLVAGACSRSTPAPSGEVWLFDQEETTEFPTARLLALDTATGKVREVLSCQGCSRPYAAGDTLYLTKVEKAGAHAEGWDRFAARLVRVDRRTGKVTEGPVFATSGLAWGWQPAGLSPDGRYLLMPIPVNPAHAVENPLHDRPGLARYDLTENRLLPDRLSEETGQQLFPSRDGSRLFLCCWIQGQQHPLPGIAAIDSASGELLAQATLPATSTEVHPTQIFPAGDGRRFYALRAGTERWWSIDGAEGTVESGETDADPAQQALTPTARAMGTYESHGGEALAHGDRAYSSLHLVQVDRTGQGRPTPIQGGGVQIFSLPDFKRLAHLEPGRPFQSALLSPDGQRLFALDAQKAEVWAFDTSTLKRTGLWQVGGRPLKLY